MKYLGFFEPENLVEGPKIVYEIPKHIIHLGNETVKITGTLTTTWIIILFFFIFVAVKLGNASDEVVEETSVESSISSDVAQQGYEDGYQAGFQFADMDMQPDAKIAFTTNFGAPSTPEEKEMYNIYKQNYDKGYREGKSAGRE